MQKWIGSAKIRSDGQYLVYINSQHNLGFNDAGEYGLVNDPSYNSVFSINGIDLSTTEAQTVKFNYKNSGRYMAVKLPQSENYVIKVGNGTAVDGSDQWVVEYAGEDVTSQGALIGRKYYVKNKKTGTYLTSTANYGETEYMTRFAPIIRQF